jgi:NADH-quinone oxidoreductase subunit B
MGVSSKLGNLGVVTTTLESAVNWGRTGSMWPILFGLACCAIEMMSMQASDYDMSRFGMELNRATARARVGLDDCSGTRHEEDGTCFTSTV